MTTFIVFAIVIIIATTLYEIKIYKMRNSICYLLDSIDRKDEDLTELSEASITVLDEYELITSILEEHFTKDEINRMCKDMTEKST